MEQLPQETQDKLLFGFVYTDFLETFHKFFDFAKPSSLKHSRFTIYNDSVYHEMMKSILLCLEPIKFSKNTTVLDELDECN